MQIHVLQPTVLHFPLNRHPAACALDPCDVRLRRVVVRQRDRFAVPRHDSSTVTQVTDEQSSAATNHYKRSGPRTPVAAVLVIICVSLRAVLTIKLHQRPSDGGCRRCSKHLVMEDEPWDA